MYAKTKNKQVTNGVGGCTTASRHWGLQLAVQHVQRWVVQVVSSSWVNLFTNGSSITLKQLAGTVQKCNHHLENECDLLSHLVI